MKKLILILPIIVLLAASCNTPQQASTQTPVVKTPVDTTKPAAPEPTLTPAPTPPFVTQTVTMQAAINIAVKDMGINATDYDINASLKNNNWYVNLAPKQPPCDPPYTQCAKISGGDAIYIIDAKTGAIISKQLGQ